MKGYGEGEIKQEKLKLARSESINSLESGGSILSSMTQSETDKVR